MDTSAEARQRIVVGVDGSPAAAKALAWALGQAEATGADVEAVQAWEVPVMYGTGMMVLPSGEDFEKAAKQSLDAAVGEAVRDRPGVRVETHAVAGHPAKTLLDMAEDADLLVVGSRGHGGFVGTLVGSVSQYCVAHAKCPVVVVHDHE
ncbi:universal stress protein [Glycomyces sp. A-F 0318]|uniref:universal stress protein n=1 Tax=Glycomyces amatae TaxID=2881355 RepID=UPI001E3C9C6A|nr:universal stress protein [Glycomyces amatae]MCD0442014.1 universal stress protein [Glycomyces amatae]